MSDWTAAKRPRQPLQSKLISDNYYNVTRPRLQTYTGTRNTVPNKCLMDFGFIRSTAIERRKRKRSAALQSNTVMDSQADSDDDPFLPGSCNLEALQATAFHRPNKRRRSTGLYVPDESASSDPPSSPLPHSNRDGMTTPITCRIRNEANDFDIPSSLSYERYDYRRWNEHDTPPRIAKFRIYTEPSPPPSSGRVEIAYSTMSPTRHGTFDVLTPPVRSRGMLTPPHSRYGPRPEPESSPFEVVPKGTHSDKRLPLADMIPSLIPSPQARRRSTESRQIASLRHGHRAASVSTTTSLASRPETPSIWHDAVESFDDATQDHNTVEDSQDQDMFDPLAPPSPRLGSQTLTTTRPAISHSQHFSWIPTSDSLMETLLPPDYGSSQYDDDFHLPYSSASSSSPSQTCRAPPPFTLSLGSRASAVRKRPGEEERDDDHRAAGKRQKNF